MTFCKKKALRIILMTAVVLCMLTAMSVTCFAAQGDVAGAVEDTWNAASGQIKSVVNKVIFPVIDLILAVLFFVKVSTAYLDYRKHGQFEWTAPAILLATLVFSLTCPLYIWNTKRFLMMDEAEGHHINPRYKGGTDEYANIAILSPEAHLLVKVTNPILIKSMLAELKLSKTQMAKLNEFRTLYGTQTIE